MFPALALGVLPIGVRGLILAVLWTPIILTFPTLWQYLQSIAAYVTPPIVAAFLAGIFWPRAKAKGAFVAIVAGVPMGVLAWLPNEMFHVTSLQFLYACGVMFVVSAAILLAGMVGLHGGRDDEGCGRSRRPFPAPGYAMVYVPPWQPPGRPLTLSIHPDAAGNIERSPTMTFISGIR